jgi:hypothetical protein
MIDELLVDAGARRDLVDAGAGEAAGGKFASRRRQQFPPRRYRIAPLRLVAISSSFGHFQPNS